MADLLSPKMIPVVRNINRTVPVTLEADEEGEWYQLKSKLSDTALYHRLKANWYQIAPPGSGFALAYCHFGPRNGVWLHFLSTGTLLAQYEEGCHETLQW